MLIIDEKIRLKNYYCIIMALLLHYYCINNAPPVEIDGNMSKSTSYYYATYKRLVTNKIPTLTCLTESDKFSSKGSSVGNKTLTYPVGLITADEVVMAGGGYSLGKANSNYYLYTNQYYWSGSPYTYSSNSESLEFAVYSSSVFDPFYVYNAYGVRPVISLSSSAKFSGDGTYNNVYTVS